MASILRVNTLTDASSGNSTAMSTVNQGTAKVWINFNGTGTIAARDSFNVASLTDEGVGAYQTNLTTSLDNTNYAVTGSAGGSGTPSGCWHTTGFNVNTYNTSNTTSSFHQQIYYTTSNVADVEFVYSAILGDLA
jgi:hypothetical protein